MASSSSSSALQRGIVKSVQSGDSIIVRGQPKGGPPPEKQINLAYLIAPKISRKLPDGTYTEDEPYAWEAREFLRKRLVGKEVAFRVEYKLPFGKGERECATVLNSLEPGTGSENISELLVSEGLVEVVKRAQNKDNPEVIRLTELEEAAKAAGKGKWAAAAAGTSPAPIKRTLLQPDLDNGQALVGKTYDGIVEHVRDGATLRVGLFTSCSAAEAATADQGAIDFQVVTLQLSGVRCPLSSEPFGEEARFFTETRLLQRDVRVRLEQFNTNGLNPSYTGTVTFLERDIAEYLLREGYAKVVDWTLALTAEPKKLRALEREAKEKRLRLWREYKGDTSGRSTAIAVPKGTASKFDAKVLEITNADSLVVQNLETKEVKKIFLSSVRPPRLPQQHNPETGEPLPNQSAAASGRQFRPLYDIPYMFEARECLRKKLIGKPVKVSIDYIQPKTDSFPEKTCCTVLAADGSNVAEQLIIKGLVTVVRYRADDDQRAADYDAYLAAEMKAQKMGKGVWNTSTSGKSAEAGLVRIADLSTDLTKSRSFAPFLTKAGQRKEAVVEYVFPSSTKLKLWIPKENCLINLILGGVNTPKPNDPTAAEAVSWAKLKVYQREVFVEIETQDKAGNYIGALYYDKTHNLAVELVRAGLLAVREYNTKAEFNTAQADAQAAKKGIWKDWQPEDPAGGDAYNGVDLEDGTEEGGAEGGATATAAASGTTAAAAATGPASGTPDDLAQRKKVVITHVSTAFTTFHAQAVDDGPKIEELQRRLREEAKNNPPLPGAYRPKRGDLAMARFSEDGQWYRVRVDKTVNAAESQVLYIDYGNREVLKNGEIAALPMGAAFSSAPPGAKEYAFAFVYPDTDPDTVEEVRAEFLAETGDKVLLLKTEYRAPESSLEAATLLVDEGATKKDVVLGLVADGWLFVDTKARRGGRLWKKFNEYKEAQEAAKKNGLNLWQYGDVTPDDAKEFGYPTLH